MNRQDPVIVHVEDNLPHADLVRRQLTRAHPGLQVIHLADGGEALDFFAGKSGKEIDRVRLVLLDLRLPKADGLDVLRAIRGSASTRQLPVVVLTTSNSPADIHSAYCCGANSYLIKPLEFSVFQDMIGTLCSYWFDWNREPA